MAEQYTPNLGHLCCPDAGRDAVHVDVAPVTAAQALRPRAHARSVDGSQVGCVLNPIGVVDPFLTGVVQPGERFWLFLYPNTVTSLRHVWTHPAFTPKPPERSSHGA